MNTRRTATALVAVALMACGGSAASQVPTTVASTTTTTVMTATTASAPTSSTLAGTAGASLACDHFRNVMDDFGAGLYTTAELRAKLQEVEGNTSIGTAEMQAAARTMLAAVTQDDAEAFVAAVGEMHQACLATGN